MVAVREDRTAPMSDPIHRPGDACADGLHPTAERVTIRRFDDQVGVIALQGVVGQPKSRTRAAGDEAALYFAHDRDGP